VVKGTGPEKGRGERMGEKRERGKGKTGRKSLETHSG